MSAVARTMFCVVLTCLLALSSSLCQTRELPQSLGRLNLVRTLKGKEAQAFLDRLHQKAVPPTSSVTGEYGALDKSATLYVSIYRTNAEAREAGSRMMRLIKGGNRTFGHYSEETRSSIRVGRCVGMGQIHYLFQHGVRVYWLGTDPAVEQEALEGLLKALAVPNKQ